MISQKNKRYAKSIYQELDMNKTIDISLQEAMIKVPELKHYLDEIKNEVCLKLNIERIDKDDK